MRRPFDRYARRVVVLAAALLLPAPLLAADASTEARLARIERQLESRGLIDMFNQLEQLQRDVQQLRGELEVQTHQSGDLQRRQREQYLDIDRRLQQLETGGAPAAALPPATLPPTAPASAPPPVLAPPPSPALRSWSGLPVPPTRQSSRRSTTRPSRSSGRAATTRLLPRSTVS